MKNLPKPKIVHGLPPTAEKSDRVSFDTEFFNMNKTRLHRPHGDFAFLGCTFDGKTVYYITDESQISEFLARINESVWILAHAKFDIGQLRRYTNVPNRKRLWDVLLIDQIMYSGYYDSFSLADLARRRLDVYLEKSERASFSATEPTDAKFDKKQGVEGGSNGDADVGDVAPNLGLPRGNLMITRRLTKEQVEYAAKDVIAAWLVYQDQRAEIDETDLNIWKDIELPTLWSVLSMKGMKLDVDAWIKLYEQNEAKANKIQDKYATRTSRTLRTGRVKEELDGLNLSSPVQVKKHLHGLGYTRLKSTDEDTLKEYADECEFVCDLLEYRGYKKAAGTYGKKWLENGVVESDGRIYSDFHQIGAATGRFSSSRPNVENIPVRDTPEFRKCFVAGEDHVLIDADWSAQEPRITAHLSGDEKLINIFQESKDVYIESGRLMFGWEMDKKDPRRKTRMKPTVLGACYGLTEFGMEIKYGVPKDEGRELLDAFFETFDGVREWKKKQQKIRTHVTTIYGRKYWLNIYQKGWENNCLNSPVQGSAADAMKIAGAWFTELAQECGYGDKVWIINYVHDELLLECHKDALDWVLEYLRLVMIDVAEKMHDTVPADVEIKAGHSWHDAHN